MIGSGEYRLYFLLSTVRLVYTIYDWARITIPVLNEIKQGIP